MRNDQHAKTSRRLRPLIPLAVVSAATAFGVGLAGAQQPAHPGPPPATSSQIATLRTSALAFAGRNGEPKPIRGELVGGTRASAVALLMNGAEVDTDPDVYAVELEGKFTLYQLPVPANAPIPTARFLTLVYDARSDQLLDWGFSNDHRDLSGLGSPRTIFP